MDTGRLRYFCAVARTGSLRRAAELVKVSPPALSKAIKLLESECGVRLIDWGITYVPIPHPDLDFLPAATVTMD